MIRQSNQEKFFCWLAKITPDEHAALMWYWSSTVIQSFFSYSKLYNYIHHFIGGGRGINSNYDEYKMVNHSMSRPPISFFHTKFSFPSQTQSICNLCSTKNLIYLASHHNPMAVLKTGTSQLPTSVFKSILVFVAQWRYIPLIHSSSLEWLLNVHHT